MKKAILGYAMCFLMTATSVWAAPVISIGTQYMLATDSARTIPILVSSTTAERVEAAYLAVQIGDGGTANLGTNAAPRITNLDIVGPGTIFNASNLGATPLYLGTPSLIALTETLTNPNVAADVEANGVLAYLTVNPNGAAIGSYAIGLQNVGQNVSGGDWDTQLHMPAASIPGGNSIQIVALHQSAWKAGANGNWTNTAGWTSTAPPVPNYTTQAVVNTNYTVDVTSAQEADSLTLSNGGKVALSSTGSLAITQLVNVSTGGVLSVAPGSSLSATGVQLSGGTISGNGTLAPAVALSAGGTLDAPLSGDTLNVTLTAGGTGSLTKTGLGTAVLQSNAAYSGDTNVSAGRLQLNGPSSTLHAVTGAGELAIAAASTATADSIAVGTLTIGASSKVTINPIAGGPLAGSSALNTVPEPSTIAMLLIAGLGMLVCRKKMR